MCLAAPAAVTKEEACHAARKGVEPAIQSHGDPPGLDGRNPRRDGVHAAVPLNQGDKPVKMTMAAVLSLALLSLGARAEVDAKTQRTFKAKCASCHGADGKGATDQGKKMGVKPFAETKKSDAELKAAIENGVKTDKGEMEGYKDKLSAEEITNLVALIKTQK
jgi:mono/diheme cytochrome c family protein